MRAILAFALLATLTAPARADDGAVRVLVRGDLDATAVAAAIAAELGVATSLVDDEAACVAPCAVVDVTADGQATVEMRGAAGATAAPTLTRTLELPAGDAAGAEVVALIVGNLARDQAAALLDGLAPPPSPPPAAVLMPVVPRRVVTPRPTVVPRGADERARFSLGLVPLLGVEVDGARGGAGVAVDLVVGVHRHLTAFNVAGVGSVVTGDVVGTQIGGAFAVAGDVQGAQVGGAVAIARTVRGAQVAGAVAVAGDVDTQVSGALNVAHGRVRGAQVAGAVNVAHRLDGVQVGVVNVAGSGDGVSIGLINLVRGGRTELEATVDDRDLGALVLRHGSRRWHNVYGVAARAERTLVDDEVTDDDMWMYGLGFGPSWRAGATTVDVEAMAWHVVYGDDFGSDLDLLAQLRAVVGHPIGPAAVVVGGALNTYVTTDAQRATFGARLVPGAPPPMTTTADDVRVEVWPSVFVGVRL